MITRRSVYIASPLGFSETGRLFYTREILPLLKRMKFTILDPWSLVDEKRIRTVAQIPYGRKRQIAWRKLNHVIARTNQQAIDDCDMMLAILDGADVDSGTAAEVGYAFARGKRIVGYRNDTRLAGENDGATVNLQLEYFIRESGGMIVRTIKELPAALQAKG